MNTAGKVVIVIGVALVIGVGIYFATTSNLPKKKKKEEDSGGGGGGGGFPQNPNGPSDFASLLNALKIVGDPLLGGVAGERLEEEKRKWNTNLSPDEKKQFIALVYKKKKNWKVLDGIEFAALLVKWRKKQS